MLGAKPSLLIGCGFRRPVCLSSQATLCGGRARRTAGHSRTHWLATTRGGSQLKSYTCVWHCVWWESWRIASYRARW